MNLRTWFLGFCVFVTGISIGIVIGFRIEPVHVKIIAEKVFGGLINV